MQGHSPGVSRDIFMANAQTFPLGKSPAISPPNLCPCHISCSACFFSYSSRLKTFTAVAPADDDWRPLQQSRRQMMTEDLYSRHIMLADDNWRPLQQSCRRIQTEDLYSSRATRWLKTFTAVVLANDHWRPLQQSCRLMMTWRPLQQLCH